MSVLHIKAGTTVLFTKVHQSLPNYYKLWQAGLEVKEKRSVFQTRLPDGGQVMLVKFNLNRNRHVFSTRIRLLFNLTWCITTVTLKFNFIWRKRLCRLKIHV